MAFRKFSVGKEDDEGEEREKVSFFYFFVLEKKEKKTPTAPNWKPKKKTHALLLAAAIATPTIGTRLPHMIHHGNRRNRLQPICGRSDV